MAVFPLGLSNGPPPGSKATSGRDALEEVAANGVNFIRTGMETWSLEGSDGLIADQKKIHAAAHANDLRCWLALGTTANLPATANSPQEQLLRKIVTAFRNDPALLAYKGVDEPRNPARGDDWIRPDGLVRAHTVIKKLDPNHPVVIVQAPRGKVADLIPYRPAFDITGVDIYPVAYPPAQHSDSSIKDIRVVGDMARKTHEAAGGKPFWMTLQIAWTGVLPSKSHPGTIPRFPNLQQERFMAYEAIVNGARGLSFFGGHLTQVLTPVDAASGWNWSFWRRVLRPVVSELASDDLRPALLATHLDGVVTSPRDEHMEHTMRRGANHIYVIAVRTGGSVAKVGFSGLPKGLTSGEVLFEYVQSPPPPPIQPGKQAPRRVKVSGGAFSDWFAPYDAHVYRFAT